jgi:hypothetical protein
VVLAALASADPDHPAATLLGQQQLHGHVEVDQLVRRDLLGHHRQRVRVGAEMLRDLLHDRALPRPAGAARQGDDVVEEGLERDEELPGQVVHCTSLPARGVRPGRNRANRHTPRQLPYSPRVELPDPALVVARRAGLRREVELAGARYREVEVVSPPGWGDALRREDRLSCQVKDLELWGTLGDLLCGRARS